MHDQHNNAEAATAPAHFLPIAEVCQIAGVGESTIWEWSRRGKFPKPVKLATRTTRWVSTEVERWQADVLAKRA
ncbi:helix-turn-helix transcriptional regulator [Xanthomonas massiliensis]|uniref:helix-turn-helix transcriptional regulator n=1 Tax=Xanthomonas massiliensis TaxID=1720302 RepID=UPI0008253CE8|nr:AlpA family phage regulatory protein [Xanthomonas massiliensis]